MIEQTIICFSLLALVSWPVLADEPTNVPLDGSWCCNVKAPGMHKMATPGPIRWKMGSDPTGPRQPAGPPESEEGTLIRESLMALVPTRIDYKLMINRSPGFAVVGTGLEALRHAHDIWVRKEPVKLVLPADTDLSLVIRTSNNITELSSLTRDYYPYMYHDVGQFFELKYVLPYFDTTRPSFYEGPSPNLEWAGIALISIGKLPVGRYEVRITRVPYEPKSDETLKPIPPEWEDVIICQPFVFTTVKND